MNKFITLPSSTKHDIPYQSYRKFNNIYRHWYKKNTKPARKQINKLGKKAFRIQGI